MNSFKSLNIPPVSKCFRGDKIRMIRLLNREITVRDYKIVPSKFPDKGTGKCLQLQISVGETNHVLFTGSSGLLEQIEKVTKSGLPFSTTIIEDDQQYKFS